MHLFPYLVARSSAASLDRQGPPGRLFTILVMGPIAVAMVGLAGVAAVAIGAVLFSLI